MVNNREEDLPEVGRYNGGQKLLFFLMVLCLAGLFALRHHHLARLLPVCTSPWARSGVASALHALCAFVLICGIIVHIYAAIWVKGSVRAMTRGTVTPGWAWKHHRAWLREVRHAADSRPRPD